MHYPMAVILPPKIYHYEPKIFGFKIAGKRGSQYFQPPKGNVRYIEDSVQGLELEEVNEERRGRGTAAGGDRAAKVAIDFTKKLSLGDADAAKGAAASSTGEENEATLVDGSARAGGNQGGGQGKKNRKKNKK